MVILVETNQLDELWFELNDNINELADDLKGNRRGLRHLRTLKETVNNIDAVMKSIPRKGIFK